MEKELRTEVVKFRVTPTEKKQIQKYAQRSATHESDYARSVCLAGYRIKHHTQVSAEDVFEVEPGSMQIRHAGETEGQKINKHAAG